MLTTTTLANITDLFVCSLHARGVALLGAVPPRGVTTLTTNGLQYECWGVKLILRTEDGGWKVEKKRGKRGSAQGAKMGAVPKERGKK